VGGGQRLIRLGLQAAKPCLDDARAAGQLAEPVRAEALCCRRGAACRSLPRLLVLADPLQDCGSRNITRRPILNPGGPSPLWCNQRNVSDTGMNWEGPDVYIDGGVTNYWTTPAQADWQS
jgi:hypothetical protein